MSQPLSAKRIRRIVAITCLVFLLGSVTVSLTVSLTPYFVNFWQNHHQELVAATRYRVISLAMGTGLSVIIYRSVLTIFNLLSINNVSSLITGSFALFIFCALILSLGERTILNYERSKNTCELVRTGLWWSKTQQLSLQKLQGAYIQVDGKGDDTAERVALLTSQGDILMTYASYSPGQQEETSRQINFFVKHPERESLQVSEDNRSVVILVGIGLSIIIFLIGIKNR